MLNVNLNLLRQQQTPFYLYDLGLLERTLEACQEVARRYGYLVHYALKANVNEPLLASIRKHGFGADCVSGNEIRKALKSGFKPEQIVFAGVGKTDNEIIYALEQEIFCFNCESLQELVVLNDLAAQTNTKARIALRINPNVNAGTHHYITTGLEENKFGINSWELPEVWDLLRSLPNLEFIGLHFHIGSQITDMHVYEELCHRVNEIQEWFEARNFLPHHLNLGGGLGVDYYHPDEHPMPDFHSYFSIFNKLLHLRPGQQVHFELGRSLVAQCGNLIASVLYIKKGIKTNFVILDGGMTELIRPALYQSYHQIENLTSHGQLLHYDVVGPVCESSDCFGKSILLPETNRGDLIAIRSAGAYGEVMSSQYNLRDKAGSIYIGAGK